VAVVLRLGLFSMLDGREEEPRPPGLVDEDGGRGGSEQEEERKHPHCYRIRQVTGRSVKALTRRLLARTLRS